MAPHEPSLIERPDGPIVLFDGVCNLCNGGVNFVLEHERAPILRFASLQSGPARRLLDRAFAPSDASHVFVRSAVHDDPTTAVLIEGGRTYTHSTAALRITRYLRTPYRWLFALVIVPRPLRDLVYRWIAENRYRWFGRSEICRISSPELRSRFLDGTRTEQELDADSVVR